MINCAIMLAFSTVREFNAKLLFLKTCHLIMVQITFIWIIRDMRMSLTYFNWNDYLHLYCTSKAQESHWNSIFTSKFLQNSLNHIDIKLFKYLFARMNLFINSTTNTTSYIYWKKNLIWIALSRIFRFAMITIFLRPIAFCPAQKWCSANQRNRNVAHCANSFQALRFVRRLQDNRIRNSLKEFPSYKFCESVHISTVHE